MRYHEKSFEDMKQRLASYKSTLSITFDAINIRVQCSTEDSLNDLKDSIQGTKEDLEDQLDQVRETISSADVSVQGVLQADQTHLQKSLESLERAQWVLSTTQPQVIIKSNRAVQGSRAIFGTDVSQPEFSMNKRFKNCLGILGLKTSHSYSKHYRLNPKAQMLPLCKIFYTTYNLGRRKGTMLQT
ncbi:hypothetical protein MW887_004588 [Aspergillus wentii]|nr:hypothetical protein MW887_004588 [Aspergillus wentii]